MSGSLGQPTKEEFMDAITAFTIVSLVGIVGMLVCIFYVLYREMI